MRAQGLEANGAWESGDSRASKGGGAMGEAVRGARAHPLPSQCAPVTVPWRYWLGGEQQCFVCAHTCKVFSHFVRGLEVMRRAAGEWRVCSISFLRVVPRGHVWHAPFFIPNREKSIRDFLMVRFLNARR